MALLALDLSLLRVYWGLKSNRLDLGQAGILSFSTESVVSQLEPGGSHTTFPGHMAAHRMAEVGFRDVPFGMMDVNVRGIYGGYSLERGPIPSPIVIERNGSFCPAIQFGKARALLLFTTAQIGNNGSSGLTPVGLLFIDKFGGYGQIRTLAYGLDKLDR